MDKKAQWSLVGAVWVLAIGALFLGWLFLQKSFSGHDAQDAPQPMAQVGEKVVDPVTKAEFVLAADTRHANYQGRNYYFLPSKDGQDDMRLFLTDPELYLHGVSSFTTPLATPAGLSPSGAAGAGSTAVPVH